MAKLILIGAGGHSKVIRDIISEMNNIELYALLDDSFKGIYEIDGVIQSNTNFIETIDRDEYVYCIAIGNNVIRKTLFEKFQIPVERYAKLIHPSAIVSHSAKIGYGTVVMPNVVVNADSVIGNHCILNTGSVVEHDNKLEDFTHI